MCTYNVWYVGYTSCTGEDLRILWDWDNNVIGRPRAVLSVIRLSVRAGTQSGPHPA